MEGLAALGDAWVLIRPPPSPGDGSEDGDRHSGATHDRPVRIEPKLTRLLVTLPSSVLSHWYRTELRERLHV